MAELKISLFCSLATSPSWHTWLYNYNESIYNNYMAKLHESKGCNFNRELMVETLDIISNNGGYEQLLDFIRINYPYMVIDDYVHSPRNVIRDEVFPDYVPDLLTYPRRIVFVGEPDELNIRIQKFTFDKIRYDSIIVGNKGYVEYLTQTDAAIIDQIPMSNWLIAGYRKNKV